MLPVNSQALAANRPSARTACYAWRIDAKPSAAIGTILVQDIAPGLADSSPMQVTAVGHQLFFSADDGASGRELWVLPIALPAPAGPTPAIPLPHQIFLPHAQSNVSC